MKGVAALAFLAFLSTVPASAPSADSKAGHIQLSPHFVEGATLRYRIEANTSSDQHTATPIVDSQSGSKFQQMTIFLVRLDVLGVRPAVAPQDSAREIRFRATFEKSRSNSSTDASLPPQNSLDEGIDSLEGHSFEFTLGPAAEPSSVTGLDQLTQNRAAAEAALEWIPVLANAGNLPTDGVLVGQKWSSEHPVSGLPLAGVIWRSESTYLRDEPCPGTTVASNSAPPHTQELCAVIITHFDMSRRGSQHADATPDDYRRNGLRTSGKWNAIGESLNSVSLSDGFLVASTQTAAQDMDYEILSASSGSRIRQVGHTNTRTEINLVRDATISP